MGDINSTVEFELSQRSTSEQELIRAFMHNFSIGWFREYARAGTVVSAYLLKPDKSFSDTGYAEEILLTYSRFPTVEPRFLRVTEEIFADPDVNGRVDPYAYFLVSDAANAVEKIDDILSGASTVRMPVVFTSQELIGKKHDPWFVRQRFLEKIAGRDLFDVRLPLHDDMGFFGRKEALASIIDSTRKSENVGIFGLRKVGKTSVLFRAREVCVIQDIAKSVYIDCKRPDIWTLSYDRLLEYILNEMFPERPNGMRDKHVVSQFRECILSSQRRVLIIFDEIEFISPLAGKQSQWMAGFVPFWQTIWSVQSESRKLSVVIAGVNSTLLEKSTIDKVQNPLFSLVKPLYLGGLKDEDLRQMVRILGRKMGLSIDYAPAMWLNARFGGHPLLTRLACSVLHNIVKDRGEVRPYVISTGFLDANCELLDSGVLFYSEHVVSSLQDAFASEYRLLSALAGGRKVEFYDQAKNALSVQHLISYGLVRKDDHGSYSIAIKVVEEYLIQANGAASKNGLSRWVAPANQRATWVRERCYRILKDFRFLHQLLQSANASVFGPVILPEAENFACTQVVNNEAGFDSFINCCNRTFVESLEQYGKSIGRTEYFWNEPKVRLPHLWRALHRIKLYRNDSMHLVLKGTVIAEYAEYLREDIGSITISNVPDIHFLLQQAVLDGLLHALQLETARFDR